ncbi:MULTISPECIES: DUF2207 family protein [Kordiimonas]|jgi:hypothetical protein|uniref:DUF2207 family protein n=1 Tax=Kordiimonas TaxID=288021 RepID=UPI00257E66CE|nr:DUF2207 domain-containing protein [Kordiimonas sp. UBA4487]
MTSVREQVSVSYEPTPGISPALARTKLIGGYDTRTFAVAILSLVQDGFLEMKPEQDGSIRLRRKAQAWLPQGSAAQWLLKALVGKDDFALGPKAYVRLLTIRKGHAARLLKENNRVAGNGGMFIMAGLGLVVLMSVFVAAVAVRAPLHLSAWEILLPYWPLLAVAVGGLWFWRMVHMREKNAKLQREANEVERYRRYIEVAQAERLDPRFAADGAYKFHDPDTVYAAAFGVKNAWADPVVHLLESLLPATIEGAGYSKARTDKDRFIR